jgi:uncharacterized membrane protein (TIGR02234 family)
VTSPRPDPGSDERAARQEPNPGPGRPGRRLLVLVCLALVAAAAALEGAARLGWFTTSVDAVGRGTVPVTATGADLLPGLSGVALLGLAAVAAAVALAGPGRRLLGGLVAAAGCYVGVALVRLLLARPSPADLAALPDAPAGGTPGASTALQAGPLPAGLGAILLVAAGVALLAAERRFPRFGARYAARPAERRGDADPDRAAWEALDAGRDPTADPGSDPTGPTRAARSDAGPPGDPV